MPWRTPTFDSKSGYSVHRTLVNVCSDSHPQTTFHLTASPPRRSLHIVVAGIWSLPPRCLVQVFVRVV